MDSGSGRSAVRLRRFDWDVEDRLLSFCGESGPLAALPQDGRSIGGGAAPDDCADRDGDPGSPPGTTDGAAEDPGEPQGFRDGDPGCPPGT